VTDSNPNPGLPEKVWEDIRTPQRLAVVRSLETLGQEADADFDRLTRLAAAGLDAPVALLSLIDVNRQWFKARHGTDISETTVDVSFCAHGVASRDPVLIVNDATSDPRFRDNPLVTGPEQIRFYAGAPIEVGGERIGAICVLDRRPREEVTQQQVDTLVELAGLAASLFVLKDGMRSGALARVALAREEKRRAIALEAAALASWIWDVQAGNVECDESLPVMFGMRPTGFMSARTFFRAIDPRDARRTSEAFRAAITGGDDYSGEYRVSNMNPTRWLAARGSVVERLPDGRPLLVFGVNYDITARKETEERQRLLLRELNHRVKNTLATVQALATQTVRHASDPRAFLTAFSARLQALGAAHSLLSDREWKGISLRELARMEIAAFDDATGSRIHVDGADILVTPDQAVGLGMILHELASNALKYGALSVPSGSVRLDWTLQGTDPERRLTLNWQESGGPQVQTPQREGFGMILIRRSLSKVISSTVDHEFRPQGVVARVSLPLQAVDHPDGSP
jgi:PAS domain S-box-containing protein